MPGPKRSGFVYDNDTGYAELATQFRGKGSSVFIGFLQSSGMYKPKAVDEGRKSSGPPAPPRAPITVAQIAAIHEFGSSDGKHPPQRSFMGSTLDVKDYQLRLLLTKLLGKVVDGDMPQGIALGLVGQQCVDWFRAAITAGLKPALSAATLARKGAGKTTPLIDTGQLIGSISWELRKANGSPGGKAK